MYWKDFAGYTNATNYATTSGSSNTVSIQKNDWYISDPLDERRLEDQHKLRSGVWKQEIRYDTGVEEWTLDCRAVEEHIQRISTQRSRDLYERFRRSPEDYLDTRFGKGTARAMREHHMADKLGKDLMKHYMSRALIEPGTLLYDKNSPSMPIAPKGKEETFSWRSPAQFPFRLRTRTGRVAESVLDDDGDLLASLQRDCNDLLSDQLRLVRSWKS